MFLLNEQDQTAMNKLHTKTMKAFKKQCAKSKKESRARGDRNKSANQKYRLHREVAVKIERFKTTI
jgi:hypothetical protein